MLRQSSISLMEFPHRSDPPLVPPTMNFEQLLAGLADHHNYMAEEMMQLIERNRCLNVPEPTTPPECLNSSSVPSRESQTYHKSSCSTARLTSPRPPTTRPPTVKGDDDTVMLLEANGLPARKKFGLAIETETVISEVDANQNNTTLIHTPSLRNSPRTKPASALKVAQQESVHSKVSSTRRSRIQLPPSLKIVSQESYQSYPSHLSSMVSSVVESSSSNLEDSRIQLPKSSFSPRSCLESSPKNSFSPKSEDSSVFPAEHGVYPHWFKPRHGGFSVHLIQDALYTRPVAEHTARCILSPMGGRRLCWDVFWSLLLCYEMWILPIDLVFTDTTATPQFIEVMRWLLIFFFAVDIILNFNTGYFKGEEEVLDRRLISQQYLGTWFALDVIATVPWGEVLTFLDGDASQTASSTVRVGKVSKLIKLLKMSKLVRAAKIARHVQLFRKYVKQRSFDSIINRSKGRARRSGTAKVGEFVDSMGKTLVVPLQILGILLLLSHLLACCHGAFVDLPYAEDFDAALRNYSSSLWWAYSLLSFGSNISQSFALHTDLFFMCALWGRVVLAFLACMCVLQLALRVHAEKPGDVVWKRDALAYLRSHTISENTQVQVLKIAHENGRLHKRQRNFNNLMSNLPIELAKTIRTELWCDRLNSLGLICELATWCNDFLSELAQVVQEEAYASKVIVFKEGDAAVIAYKVLNGSVAIFDSTRPSKYIAPFTADMWFGEKALVNPDLRRSATAVTESVTHLMAIPAADYFSLIERFGLKSNYQYFCVNELWKGLCGRCGALGDHWSNECKMEGLFSTPLLIGHSFESQTERHHSGRSGSRRSVEFMSRLSEETNCLARDLRLFVNRFQLENLVPTLLRLGIYSLDDCLSGDKMLQLHEDIEYGPFLREAGYFTHETIDKFKSTISGATKAVLQVRVGADSHYFFLSHYKVEAGTEAALMRSELEALINATESHPAQQLKTPIFLDSEDLTSLFDLMRYVRNSHNVVVMLTKNFLTRPWCLVEIATAVQEGIPLIPVNIMKAGCEFEFPDAKFYEDLMNGTILGVAGLALLKDNGIDISEVIESIKIMLKRIAIPYSPHRPVAIRRTECQAMLRIAKMRDVMDICRSGSKPGDFIGFSRFLVD